MQQRKICRIVGALALWILPASSLALAQEPAQADTSVRDSTKVRKLPEITVTRTPEPLERAPYAVGVLDRT